MSSPLTISIILCSCNRAAGLRQTLEALGRVRIRPDWEAEVIVVDNASTDETASVAQNTKLANMDVKYLFEGRKGKGHALNAGLGNARGEILLFTDDDVLIPEDWVEEMVAALDNEKCDAVTGQITLAAHLLRPWLTPIHRWWLASSHDAQPREGSRELIGANMGFRRAVLERVPAFETELGPGALGLGEDTLFGWQLVAAGYTIRYAPKAKVIHQLNADRLRRLNWHAEARKHGKTEAYLLHHWEHGDIKHPRLTWLKSWIKLHLRRMWEKLPPLEGEGCPRWEASLIETMAWCEQFQVEQRRPRNYSRRGLVKRGA